MATQLVQLAPDNEQTVALHEQLQQAVIHTYLERSLGSDAEKEHNPLARQTLRFKCPCCSESLLRHYRLHKVYWFCPPLP